jgi:hypothetical protein
MTVTSAQHVDCYADHVGKGDAPWRRSFGPADRGSRGSLRCLAADIYIGGMKSKSPSSRRNSGLYPHAIGSSNRGSTKPVSWCSRTEDGHVQEDRGDNLGGGVRDAGRCFSTRCAHGSRNRSRDHDK